MGRKQRGGIVYSTGNVTNRSGTGSSKRIPRSKQDLRVHLDRMKGNKIATRITDFIGSEDDMKDLAKLLKSRCGVGGTAKDGIIIIQGDHREKIMAILAEEGYKAKKSGG